MHCVFALKNIPCVTNSFEIYVLSHKKVLIQFYSDGNLAAGRSVLIFEEIKTISATIGAAAKGAKPTTQVFSGEGANVCRVMSSNPERAPYFLFKGLLP